MPIPVLPAPLCAHSLDGPGSRLQAQDITALATSLASWAPRAGALAARLVNHVPAADRSTPTPAAAVTVVTGPDEALPAEGYTLSLAADRWTLRAADEAGAFWAVLTLTQLVRDGQVPSVDISDHPAYPVSSGRFSISRRQPWSSVRCRCRVLSR